MRELARKLIYDQHSTEQHLFLPVPGPGNYPGTLVSPRGHIIPATTGALQSLIAKVCDDWPTRAEEIEF
jgi:hypothetical protein